MEAKDFVDFSGFYLSLGAVDGLIESANEGTVTSGVDVAALVAHRAKANAILKLIAPKMDEGISVLLTELTEKANIRLKTAINAGLTGNSITQYQKRAKLLSLVFHRLMAHTNVLRDVLGEASAKGVATVRASGMGPVDTIAAVAQIATASGTNARLKKWTMTASGIVGKPVSDTDRIANDIVEVKALTDKANVATTELNTLDPGDPDVGVLAEKKARLEMARQKVIDNSVNPTSTQTAAAQQKADDSQKTALTLVGQKIQGGITPDQERCVMARGKLVIAAGAGSGKTRVLAAKVIHHIQELDHPAHSIMAVSFSVKSAGELRDRVKLFGTQAGLDMSGLEGDKVSEDFRGFGTTHSVARLVLNASGRYKISGHPNAPNNQKAISGGTQNSLIRAAVAQVKMKSRGGAASMPRDAMTFFPNLGKGDFNYLDSMTAVKQPVADPSQSASPLSYYLEDAGRFAKLLDVTATALTQALSSLTVKSRELDTKYGKKTVFSVSGPGISQFGAALGSYSFNGARGTYKTEEPKYRSPERYEWWVTGFGADANGFKSGLFAAVGIDKVQNSLNAVAGMKGDPKKLTGAQRTLLQTIVTQPIVSTALTANGMSTKRAADLAALEQKMNDDEADNERGDFHYWFQNPANQWFNLGATDKDFEVSDGKGKGGKKKVGLGAFKRYISLNKNNLRAPGDLHTKAGGTASLDMVGEDEPEEDSATLKPGILSAVYGAYEWLKSNDASTRSRLDYDDQLIQAARVLTESPQLLRRLQMQYKCILVDEAQDLNAVQHHLFGLIAGYTDPKTLTPRKSPNITADTFAFIGDDKQAIYEFRGAEPDQFIEKSDAFERRSPASASPAKGDFKTVMLDKNFRSGKAIVDAANKLIAYNSKQIPMQCTTDPKKGEGTILREKVGFAEEGPSVMVDRITSDLESITEGGGAVPEKFYKKYGLAARTNRELIGYQMALVSAGIPFRSKRDPFEGPALKPIVSLFRMFLTGTTVDVRNRGFLDGMKAPDRGLGYKTVSERLDGLKAGDYYGFCKSGGYDKVYSRRADQFKALEEYSTKFLPQLENTIQKGSSQDVLDYILNTKGANGQTFIDQLAVAVRNDAEAMEEAEELAASDDGDGLVTDDVLRQIAAKPIEPLQNLAKKYPKAKDFVGYLNSLATKSLQINKTDAAAKPNDNLVTIDTVHGWKGLECEHLFVPMSEGRFPIVRPDAEDPERAMESERRLAYVAITRGESSVTIIEPTMRMSGDKVKPVQPSRFVDEACIKVRGRSETAEVPSSSSKKTASATRVALATGDFSEFLMPVYDHREVRASEIGNGIEPPWGEPLWDVGDELEAQWGETADDTLSFEAK
jgi:DNA helicase-2/ATP-dependent DNA helicase PcrA